MDGRKIIGFILIGFGSFFFILGILIGGGFLTVSGIMNSSIKEQQKELEVFKEHAVETTGIVLDAGDGGTRIGYYDATEPIWYEAKFDAYYSKYDEHSEITVYYDEQNPEKCMVPELTIGVLDMLVNIFRIIGGIILGIFVLLGLLMVIVGFVLKKKPTRSYDL